MNKTYLINFILESSVLTDDNKVKLLKKLNKVNEAKLAGNIARGVLKSKVGKLAIAGVAGWALGIYITKKINIHHTHKLLLKRANDLCNNREDTDERKECRLRAEVDILNREHSALKQLLLTCNKAKDDEKCRETVQKEVDKIGNMIPAKTHELNTYRNTVELKQQYERD